MKKWYLSFISYRYLSWQIFPYPSMEESQEPIKLITDKTKPNGYQTTRGEVSKLTMSNFQFLTGQLKIVCYSKLWLWKSEKWSDWDSWWIHNQWNSSRFTLREINHMSCQFCPGVSIESSSQDIFLNLDLGSSMVQKRQPPKHEEFSAKIKNSNGRRW